MQREIPNPSAFPSGDKAHFPTSTFDPGMTLRDWFAGMALASAAGRDLSERSGYTAKRCYMVADAMLAERAKSEGRTDA